MFTPKQYRLKTRSGDVARAYFGERETKKAVSAAPSNAERVITGTFIKNGRFPKPVGLNLDGQSPCAYRRRARAYR
ncbi:MAG: hypothetical protein J0H42_29615 [Rhizobiales bacterium]|nr:hypothetical protein [Hyphomicrobiales bacterium]